jgi:tRNA threonylcarbamoyladenosine biosynthesis protein TsaE
MVFYTDSPEETEEIGKRLASALDGCNIPRAFVAMRGEMGVGKTAFTRGFAIALGVSGVKSPTYTIVNEYRGKRRIFHFDTYRISDGDDLYSTGFDDYVETDGYTIVEWSENIEDYIPEDAIFVTISREGGECGRRIEITSEKELVI